MHALPGACPAVLSWRAALPAGSMVTADKNDPLGTLAANLTGGAESPATPAARNLRRPAPPRRRNEAAPRGHCAGQQGTRAHAFPEQDEPGMLLGGYARDCVARRARRACRSARRWSPRTAAFRRARYGPPTRRPGFRISDSRRRFRISTPAVASWPEPGAGCARPTTPIGNEPAGPADPPGPAGQPAGAPKASAPMNGIV